MILNIEVHIFTNYTFVRIHDTGRFATIVDGIHFLCIKMYEIKSNFYKIIDI